MSFSIIFNKDTMFLLAKAQQQSLWQLNKNSTDFMPCFPLWCNLGEEEILPASVLISSPILQGENLIFPVSVKTDSKTLSLFILAGKSLAEKKIQKTALQNCQGFPISPRVFRIAQTVCIGENGFGTKNSKWIKLS